MLDHDTVLLLKSQNLILGLMLLILYINYQRTLLYRVEFMKRRMQSICKFFISRPLNSKSVYFYCDRKPLSRFEYDEMKYTSYVKVKTKQSKYFPVHLNIF